MSNVLQGYTNAMVPADAGLSLKELVRIALFNIDQFDKVAMEGEEEKIGRTTVELSHKKTYRRKFLDGVAAIAAKQGWTIEQTSQVGKLMKTCPPDRLYRIKGGLHSATRGTSPLAIIVSYRPVRGQPPEAGLAILGFSNEMLGSAARPIGVPAEGLEDVTELARRGELPELRG